MQKLNLFNKNKKNHGSSKKTAIITLLLILTLSVTFVTFLPTVNAIDYDTYAFLSVSPTPIGVNQQVFVTFWLDKVPPLDATGWALPFQGYEVEITKPGGSVEIKGPFTSDAIASQWFLYTPDQVGTYTFQFDFPGQTILDRYYQPSNSPEVEIVVQQDPIQSYPNYPLPNKNEYWDRPIEAENRDWWSISGNWLGVPKMFASTYDHNGAFNPYSQAPNTGHIVWTKPNQLGGLVGGQFGSGGFYTGLSYEGKFTPPVIISGILYYNLPYANGRSTLEWLRIHGLSARANWTAAQRKMMRRANRVKGIFWTAVLALIALSGFGIQQTLSRIEQRTVQRNTQVAVDSLQGAEGKAVPYALDNLVELPPELVVDQLKSRFLEVTGQQKLSLSYGLARYDQYNIDTMITGLINEGTDPEEVDNIVAALRNNESESLKKIEAAAENASSQKNWLTKTRLAIVALHLGDESLTAEMLRHQPEPSAQTWDPIQRTVFISEFVKWSGSLEPFAPLLANTDNPALRSGICLAIGGVEKPGQGAKDAWQPILQNWYERATDSGTHSAAGWALSQWKMDVPGIEETKQPSDNRNWWHATGVRFARIPTGNVRGTQSDSVSIVIKEDYWLSDCEITVGHFKQFMADEEYHQQHPGMKPVDWEGANVFDNDDSPDLPVQQASWFDAVMFCNWLSWKLDLEPCYEINKSKAPERDADQPQDQKGGRPDPLEPYEVSWRREANGIRLPTEGEWEYACRAQTTTDFSFGDDQNGLVDYGWYERNSSSRTHLTGSKPCNAWGLFDMHGNVDEWCWNEIGGSYRVYRGGGWFFVSWYCQSSFRGRDYPTNRSSFRGFRVARGPTSQAKKASE